MKISHSNLLNAFKKVGLDEKNTNKVWEELKKESKPKFNVENLAYYFGAIIIMSAMGWFITDAWDNIGGLGISFLGLIYFLIFILVGRYFWFHKKLFIPGGLLITVAIWVTPLIVFGIQKYIGLWPDIAQAGFQEYHNDHFTSITGSWLIMEAAVIIVGIITLRFIRFPFLTFPIVFSLWYLSMDLISFVIGDELTWQQKKITSVFFGLAMLLCSYFIDIRTKKDFAFWGYLFGLLAFWGGLFFYLMEMSGEWSKFFYCTINLFLMLFSVIIQRWVFLIFGSTGVFIYLMHLASVVFKDSLLFPIALSFLGMAIIFLGVAYKRNKEKIDQKIIKISPNFLLNLNPDKRNV